MIDFENVFVDAVQTAVTKKFPKATVVSEFVPKPSSFPHVYIRETDNASETLSFRVTGGEANARLSYTVDVFSNKKSGKKSECKACDDSAFFKAMIAKAEAADKKQAKNT